MKHTLNLLTSGRTLDRAGARRVLLDIADGLANESQMAALMTIFLMRAITLDELQGFRDAILERRVTVDGLDARGAIDIVGTGGDGMNTFNISTAACFVVAGAGGKVVKHGNFASTSVSGASNVLLNHGVKFKSDGATLQRSLDDSGVAYLHAPLFSPLMGAVAPVRRALGVRTFFNILGPLVNPVQPGHRLLGVYNLKLARLYRYLAQAEGVECTVVHSLDGCDEASLTAPFYVSAPGGERIMTAADLGLETCTPADLSGGSTVGEAAAIFDSVLDGTAPRPKLAAVEATAALALHTLEPTLTPARAVLKARGAIESGSARRCFERFVQINS